MAKTPTSPADARGEAFVREVDEAYRQDKATELWNRYGRALLVILGLGLIAAAVYLWLQEQEVEGRGVQAEEFDAALKSLDLGNVEGRDDIETLARSDVEGYSDISRLLAAEFMMDDGNVDGAVNEYRAIAADTGLPLPLRDLARIRAARISFDDSEPQEVISALSGLAEPGSAWFGVAGEMVAAAHIKGGNPDAAGAIYREMAADEDLPPSLRDRAGQLALAYAAPDEIEAEVGLDDPLAETEPTAPDADPDNE